MCNYTLLPNINSVNIFNLYAIHIDLDLILKSILTLKALEIIFTFLLLHFLFVETNLKINVSESL